MDDDTWFLGGKFISRAIFYEDIFGVGIFGEQLALIYLESIILLVPLVY